MSLAEQREVLLQIVAGADEGTIGKLIDFARDLNKQPAFSQDDLAKFHATRNKYNSGETNTISLEDAHTYIRSLKQ